MCTAGFWTDETGIRHYFKNRMLSKTPQHQVVDFSKEGIFIKDEHGRFEGMNKYGLYAVSLSMEPRVKRNLVVKILIKIFYLILNRLSKRLNFLKKKVKNMIWDLMN